MEILLEILLAPLIELFVKIFFIGIGYIFAYFPIVFGSLGTIEPGPIEHCDDGGAYYRSKGMKFWHLTYYHNGKRYLPVETVALVGWGLIGLIVAFVWNIAVAIG